MTYNTKNYEHLLGLTGFSDELLTNHFGLYKGYVANTNTLAEKIAQQEPGSPQYAELSRRFGWEFNGMRLHELYFDAMTTQETMLEEKSSFGQKIVQDFGSVDAWRSDFLAKGSLRGIGWAMLVCDQKENRLFNIWVGEHDMGHLVGAEPLVIMDVFEHAFIVDYGMDRASYLSAFMQVIDWRVVSQRYEHACAAMTAPQ